MSPAIAAFSIAVPTILPTGPRFLTTPEVVSYKASAPLVKLESVAACCAPKAVPTP
jgi:hypothetical protein